MITTLHTLCTLYIAHLRQQGLGLWRELDWNSEIQVRVDPIRMAGGKSLDWKTCIHTCVDVHIYST